jgi:general secretion pathway protein D
LEVSSITNTVNVGNTQAYTIGTRNANTLLRLKDGETQILAGLIQDSDTRNTAGIPGLSQIPIIGRLFGTHTNDREKTEIVLAITPRIIRSQPRAATENTEFWYGTETRARLSSFSSGNMDWRANPGASSGGVAGGAPGPVGPRVSDAQPVVPQPAVSAPPAGPPPIPSGTPPKPSVTIDGPSETRVGQDFDVTVRMSTDIPIAKLRGQVRFDPSALQLISASAGDIVPSSAGSPNVDAKNGGAQLDIAATDDPVQGEGSLMLLRFKALTARAASSINAQVSAIGSTNSPLANAASQPLSLVIKAP